jgi:hypothetical protein
VALRYDQFGDIHIKAGVSYFDDNEGTAAARDESNDTVASFGISDKKSGFYFYGAAGQREFDEQPVGFTDEATYWYGQVGINKQFIELGNTNFHVDYGQYDDWGSGTSFADNAAVAGDNPANNRTIVSSEVRRWGAGVTQNIKAAEMDLYAVFNLYDADITTAQDANLGAVDIEDWWALAAGGRINF